MHNRLSTHLTRQPLSPCRAEPWFRVPAAPLPTPAPQHFCIALLDVAHLVAGLFAQDVSSLIAASKQFGHAADVLRVELRSCAGPRRLIAAVRAGATEARLRRLVDAARAPVRVLSDGGGGDSGSARAPSSTSAYRLDSVTVEGRNVLHWAVQKRDATAVRLLLDMAGPTELNLNALDGSNHTALSGACKMLKDRAFPADAEPAETRESRAALMDCALALAADARCNPSTTVGEPFKRPDDPTDHYFNQLWLACDSALVEVVGLLVANPRCTAEAFRRRNVHGHSAFSICCSIARDR